ncbi:MAG: hypothetical protein IKS92_16135 [Victivallales bacterium]|nr:hypothetical protein [Victivallales bacterium]
MNKTEQLREMLKSGLVSASTIRGAGIPTGIVSNLMKRGEIVRVSRAIYASPETDYSDKALSMTVPQGVFCLVSALRLHNLTDENPHEMCMALRHGMHAPVVRQPPVHFIFRTEPVFANGIETRHLHGVAIRVYTLEQTLADCFQYRNKIGLDVAVSALREAFISNRVDRGKLWEAASRCRVARVMRPYLEAFS